MPTLRGLGKEGAKENEKEEPTKEVSWKSSEGSTQGRGGSEQVIMRY
jgi:hypothetical protein